MNKKLSLRTLWPIGRLVRVTKTLSDWYDLPDFTYTLEDENAFAVIVSGCNEEEEEKVFLVFADSGDTVVWFEAEYFGDYFALIPPDQEQIVLLAHPQLAEYRGETSP